MGALGACIALLLVASAGAAEATTSQLSVNAAEPATQLTAGAGMSCCNAG